MLEPFYLTTAINYPNGKPHIGHAYEAIVADVIARFQRLSGRDVRFQTGTDEHGLKMARKAREQNRSPRELADEMAVYFKDMADGLDISYDRFIRTVEPEHHAASQALWQAMADNGDLYLDRYEGWYSVRDEAFYQDDELTNGEGGERLSPQGTPVEWTVEESWFFRLSNYADKLLALYAEQPGFIEPAGRRNEMIAFVSQGLRDLSVSRTSFDWGVQVPGSDSHVMYVWVDALTNYLTGLGYPKNTDDYQRFWPAALHIIGKDIVRFHAVYWPAFLMSANLPLPKKVFGHGFVLNQGRKESKSVGNVTDPLMLADLYGVDVLRYFLVREVSLGQDGSWSHEAIVGRANSELANSFGNLVQRVLGFVAKNLDCSVASTQPPTAQDEAFLEVVRQACAVALPGHFEALALNQGLEAWMQAVFACNAYVDEQAPWTLRKTDPERMATVLVVLCNAIRDLAVAIQPVVPRGAAQVLDFLNVPIDQRGYDAMASGANDQHFVINQPSPVYPRLEPRKSENGSC